MKNWIIAFLILFGCVVATSSIVRVDTLPVSPRQQNFRETNFISKPLKTQAHRQQEIDLKEFTLHYVNKRFSGQAIFSSLLLEFRNNSILQKVIDSFISGCIPMIFRIFFPVHEFW